jgi:hypothetical protein
MTGCGLLVGWIPPTPLKKGGLMINYGLLAGLWIPPNVFKKAV